jgi:hypothetical protein
MTGENMEWEHKVEQFYMPAKFLPPIRIGDRYCFPCDKVDEIWEISGADIQALSNEEVKVTVYWRRPLHGNEIEEWRGRNAAGKTNWIGDALAVKIWDTNEPISVRRNEIRFNEYGPLDTFNAALLPAVRAALYRGIEQYGNTWNEHLDPERDPLWNARHTIEVHADCRIAEALERLDYGDVEGFRDKLGSAVGYLANALCKAIYLTREDED